MTSDAGALLLREADNRINAIARIGECFTDYRNARKDYRNARKTEHPAEQLAAQRIYGIALGYECQRPRQNAL